jgi:Domain of unknown function (DUF5615)
VPDSVGRALIDAGHEVIRLRDILPTNSPDPLVASVDELNEAILVSFDKDFKTLAPRIGIGRQRFRKLSRIGFRCDEPDAAARLMLALALVEFEWVRAQAQPAADKRMIVEIGPTYIRTIR